MYRGDEKCREASSVKNPVTDSKQSLGEQIRWQTSAEGTKLREDRRRAHVARDGVSRLPSSAQPKPHTVRMVTTRARSSFGSIPEGEKARDQAGEDQRRSRQSDDADLVMSSERHRGVGASLSSPAWVGRRPSRF